MLLRIWSDRVKQEEFEDVCNEMKIMHKQMKNAMEMVFAISPLLALQTRGWGGKSCKSTYLLRVSDGFFTFVDINKISGRSFKPSATTALKF
jgi:hypothetical protein